MTASKLSDFPEEKSFVRSTKRGPLSQALSSGEIAEVLARSESIAQAAKILGASYSSLQRRCREQGLIALYDACSERGKARNGKPRPHAPLPPRWAIILSQPGYPAVPIFHPHAATEAEALAVADNSIPKSIPRDQLSAVQEVSK